MSAPPRRARLRAGGAQAIAHTLRADGEVEGLRPGVAATLDDVRSRGDDALVESARRFDWPDFAHDRLRVPPAAIERAVERLDDRLRAAIVAASAQVRIVAEALLPDDRHVELPYGQRVRVRRLPVELGRLLRARRAGRVPLEPRDGRGAGPGRGGRAHRRRQPPGRARPARRR